MITASAPGRVNLMGEHTDYNGGFVLPTVIPYRTRVELEPRIDDLVGVWSSHVDERLEYRLGQEAKTGRWLDYVQGCTALLRATGHDVAGVELRITSDVPVGAGLSSSAALEVAVLRALRDAFGFSIDDVALALLAQRVEVEFVGVPVGAMDQLAASLGSPGTALLIDTRSLEIISVPLPAADLVVIASGVLHDHAAGDYRKRRDECDRAAAELGVGSLRELTAADEPRWEALEQPLARRVKHVVSENARALETVAAMNAGDFGQLGSLFARSHASMRDDYEVSVPQIDQLVALAVADADIYAARLTGGGFGGSIVAFARQGEGRAAAERIAAAYRAATGLDPTVLLPGVTP